jgi:cell shape-determining protein MreC
MSNYKKDKSYIKQRLEYVSPIDYISELEEKIEYLEYLKNENERLNNIIDELEELIDSYKLGKYDYQIPVYVLEEKLEKLKESE